MNKHSNVYWINKRPQDATNIKKKLKKFWGSKKTWIFMPNCTFEYLRWLLILTLNKEKQFLENFLAYIISKQSYYNKKVKFWKKCRNLAIKNFLDKKLTESRWPNEFDQTELCMLSLLFTSRILYIKVKVKSVFFEMFKLIFIIAKMLSPYCSK